MTLKLLQLNIFQGKYIDRIIEFVNQNDFDILNFQEISGGEFSKGGVNTYTDGNASRNINNETIGIDVFEELENNLPNYKGVSVITDNLVSDKKSYQGNATFYKNLELLDQETVRLQPYLQYETTKIDPATLPRAAIILTLKSGDQQFKVVNTHLAWGPNSKDEPYKLNQAKILFDKVKQIQEPFVLSGDFNLDPESQVVKWFGSIAKDLASEQKITNTLNPRIHAIEHLFPEGLAVDYIFVSEQIKVKKFRLIGEVDLSDHFGLLLEFEL